ncbi:hypothetical protein AGMMS49525_12920 [Bacteroidia bacterium]|nr:hypothetical protein AGMMS49525_12920 [Bacteroidia bacterium]
MAGVGTTGNLASLQAHWFAPTQLAGMGSGTTWNYWDVRVSWWTHISGIVADVVVPGTTVDQASVPATYVVSVRCVRNM